MKEILDTIDKAIKRLVAPVTMLVASALLSQGLEKPDSSKITIVSLMVLLALWAFGYMTLSATQAIKEFNEAGVGNIKNSILSTSFILVYLVLFVAAIKLGFDKVV